MKKVVAVIQARLGSSRLPGKSLMALAGKPMLEHVIERVRATSGVDEVVVATTKSTKDEPIVTVAHRMGVLAFQGSEHDVLERMLQAALWRGADIVMRVTADCPFWDPVIGQDVLEMMFKLGDTVDYVNNDTLTSGYPDGTDTEVFTLKALACSHACAGAKDREHVTTWMRRNVRQDTMRLPHLRWSAIKLSVDTRDDYNRACDIADRIPHDDYSLLTVLRSLGVEP